MKQVNKKSSVFITLVLLILAVVCLYNVTYSYFTATSTISGDTTFGNLNVQFGCYDEDGNIIDVYSDSTLYLYSASGTIERGQPFQISLTSGGDAIQNLYVQNYTSNTMCYVRFWIDAYVVESSTPNGDGTTAYVVDKTTNYGKYFLFTPNESVFTRTGSSVSGSTCYFFKSALGLYAGNIGNELTLTDLSETDTVPATLTGEQLQISISFEAVQRANNAYLSAFGEIGDTKGYLTSWT